jgi:ATP-dependent DNA helicase RecG
MQVKTWVVPPQKREAAYKWIRKRVKETDEQAFIVCPLIEESERETMKSAKAATAEFERLSKKVFPDLRLGLLHGKMKTDEKNKVMKEFKEGKLDILVATPVVEVGIDIPNATIMLVETAERFGLAQLHQLRGRVGRGTKQSYCLLFTDSRSGRALARLKALEQTLSGAQLAELDLKMRGPGEIYGTMQHGFPELKIASFSDFDLINRARQAAQWALDKLESYPKLRDLVQQKQSVAPN